jgi:hypothetical protein
MKIPIISFYFVRLSESEPVMDQAKLFSRMFNSFLAILFTFLFSTACQAQQTGEVDWESYLVERDHPPALLHGPGIRLTIEGSVNSGFGEAVAISGDTVVVGGTDFNIAGGDQLGRAYVFQWLDGEWVEQTRLKASDAQDGFQYDPHFGAAVAIAGDVLIVGAPGADHPGVGDNVGAVYVFQREGAEWVEQVKLEASQPLPHAWFGNRIALHGDTLAVAGNHKVGIYVYSWDGADWKEQAHLEFDGLDEAVWTQVSLALYGDTLAAGVTESPLYYHQDPSWNRTRGNYFPDSGIVFVYHRDGDTWKQSAKLEGEADFGVAVALGASSLAPEGRADTLAIGSSSDSSAGISAGAVYIYSLQGSSWQQLVRLTAADAMMGIPSFTGFFGSSLAMQDNLLLVGTRLSGAVYAYQGQMGDWTDQLKIKVWGGWDDWYGLPMDIDGHRLIVGAPGEFGNSAFVFELFSE